MAREVRTQPGGKHVINVVSQGERSLFECSTGSDLLTPGEFVLDGTDSIAAGPGGETPVQVSWPDNTCRAPGLRPSERETMERTGKLNDAEEEGLDVQHLHGVQFYRY